MASTTVPPPGYLANEDRGPSFEAFVIVMTTVATLAIAARFYSRCMTKSANGLSRFWWDDWVALACLPFILTLVVIYCYMVSIGYGKHVWNVPAENITEQLKLLFISYYVYDTGLAVGKASALLFYTRIFSTRLNIRWFRIGIYITHTINICWLIGILLGTTLTCNPISKNWKPEIDGHCGSTNSLWLASAIPSVAIDLIILVLPLPLLWKLNIGKARKFALTSIFMCGYSVIVISLGRLIMAYYTDFVQDFSYGSVPLLYWALAENPVLILSICLPAMSHLGAQSFSRLSSLASKARSNFSSSQNSTRTKGSVAGQSIDSDRRDLREIGKGYSIDARSNNSDYGSSSYKAYATHVGTQSGSHFEGSVDGFESNDRQIRVDSAVTVLRTDSASM